MGYLPTARCEDTGEHPQTKVPSPLVLALAVQKEPSNHSSNSALSDNNGIFSYGWFTNC